MALQDNNLMLLDANGFPRTIDAGNDTLGVGVDTSFAQDLAVGGNLTVTGDIISGGTMDVVVSDNFIDLSNGQGTGANKAGGLTVNVKAAAARQNMSTAGGAANDVVFSGGNTINFGGGGYDPAAAGLADGDIIEIAGAADLAGNNGLFVVDSVTNQTIVIKGASQTQSPWAQTAFENGTETAAGATLAPSVDLGVFCISDGALLDAGGNPIPVGQFVSAFDTAAKLSTIQYEAAANVSLQEAYNVGQQINLNDAQGNMEIRTDDTGTRADFRLTNQGATADYLLSAAGLLTVGSGANNKVAMSGQLTTDLVFDGVANRKISQAGFGIEVETTGAANIAVDSGAAFTVTAATAVQMQAIGGNVEIASAVNDVNPTEVLLVSDNAIGDAAITLQAKSGVGITTSGGGIDISATGGNTIIDSQTGNAQLDAPGGNVSSTASAAWAAQAGTGDASLTSTGGKVLATSSGDMDLTAGAVFDLNAASGVEIDAGGAGFSIDSSAGNSNVSADSGSLTLATTTSGNLSLTSADAIVGGAVNNIGLTSSAGQVNTLAATSSTFSSAGAMSVVSTAGTASVQGQTTLSLAAATAGFSLNGATGSSVATGAGNLDLSGAGDMNAVAGTGTATVQGVGLTARATGAGMQINHQHAGSILSITSAGSGLNAVDIDASAGGVDISGVAQVTVTSTNNVELNASGSLFLDGSGDSRLRSSGGDLLVETQSNAKSILLKTAAASTSLGTQVEGYLNLTAATAGMIMTADGVGVAAGDALMISDAGGGSIVGKATNTALASSMVIGLAVHAAGAGVSVHVASVQGSVIPGVMGAQAAGAVGSPVYLGATGAVTLTAPVASGTTVFRVGYLGSTAGDVLFAPQFIANRP